MNGGEEFEILGEAERTIITRHSSLITSVQPNPFNPQTVLSYQLPVASQVALQVYDTAGRLVATLADGWRESGFHDVTFNGFGLPSGIYFYRLKAGEFQATGKMMLVK